MVQVSPKLLNCHLLELLLWPKKEMNGNTYNDSCSNCHKGVGNKGRKGGMVQRRSDNRGQLGATIILVKVICYFGIEKISLGLSQ